MCKGGGSGNGRLDGAGGDVVPVAALFTLLWDALADLLGTAATATLLKRAARRAADRSPQLAGLVIQRQGLTHGYACPDSWSNASRDGHRALQDLIAELRPLLVEMTGQVVIRHLEQVAELRERGLFLAPQKEPS